MVKLCREYGKKTKEHNGDYLTKHQIDAKFDKGLSAINIAPEFGVEETKALLALMDTQQIDKFYNICLDSKKWKKWMMKDSVASDFDKSIISGHYVFSNNDFIFLKEKVKNFLYKKNVDLDKYLQSQIECSIIRYLRCFRIVK